MTTHEIKRYTVSGDIAYPIHEDPEGDYVTYEDHVAAIEADRKLHPEVGKNAKKRFESAMKGCKETDPIERLRFYCSLAMSGQDWLDAEPFFDALVADRKRRGEPVAKIDPNPPQLSIVWHDSPESVDRAMWEQSAIEAGLTYEELIEGSNVGETEDGEVFEFTHEQAIDGMRTQGCWGFVDTKTNTINAWAADDVDASTVLHMLAHEIGHVTGDPHDDDMQEEMRAEQFGRVAALAYRLWCEKKSDAPQPTEPVKVPSDSAIMFEWSQTPDTGDMRVDLIAFARALLDRYTTTKEQP